MDWATASLQPHMTPVFWGMVRTPEAERDMDAIGRAAAALQSVWGILDAHLGGRDFVAGDRFTMGDIPVGAFYCRYVRLPGIERAELPHCDALARPPRRAPGLRGACFGHSADLTERPTPTIVDRSRSRQPPRRLRSGPGMGRQDIKPDLFKKF